MIWHTDCDIDDTLAFLCKDFVHGFLETDEREVDELGCAVAFAHFGDECAEGRMLEGGIGEECEDGVGKFVTSGLDGSVEETAVHLCP